MAFSRGTTRLNDMPQSSRVSVACQWREKDLSVWWHLKIFLVEAAPGLVSGAAVVKVEVPAHVLLISGAVKRSTAGTKEYLSVKGKHFSCRESQFI